MGKQPLLLLFLGVTLLLSPPSARPDSGPAGGALVTAVGVGRAPDTVTSATQGRAMAERSAFLNAIREAGRMSGRAVPYDYQGPIRAGLLVKGFRITRVTRRPDGSVEVEVSVPRSGIATR